MRCAPQVLGAVLDAIRFAQRTAEIELNASTDNPLVFETGEVLSGGNFHGQPVAQALDVLAIALTTLQAIAERRVERLVNPDLSQGLPAFLTQNPGLSSGYMMVQITAAALVAESRSIAMPASIGSIPTDANQEDFVPMGMAAAFKAGRILAMPRTWWRRELLCGAQGLEFLKPLRPGRGVAALFEAVRQGGAGVLALGADRPPAPDLERACGPGAGGRACAFLSSLSASRSRVSLFARPRRMNLEKLKDTARKFEQKEDWRRAIDVYLKAIQEFESGKEPHPDLSLYNRVGDLYMKVNDPAAAVRSYERAADLYTEQGFLNNAIALCGKILRVNPGRVQTYCKLAQIHARKNMLLEAKRNLIEYLERMNHAGELDAAFDAVKVFADHFPANQEIRFMLIELLRAASREDEARKQVEVVALELESRGDAVGAQRTREQLDEAEPEEERAPPPAAPGGLVFLDTGFATPPSRTTTPRSPIVERRAATPGQVPRAPTSMPATPPAPEPLVTASAEPLEDDLLDVPIIELAEVDTSEAADVTPLDDLIEEVATSPADAEVGEIDIMLEPAFDTDDDDRAVASASPLEGLEVLAPAEDVEAPSGFEPDVAFEDVVEESGVASTESDGELLEGFEAVEQEAAPELDGDEFFVADEAGAEEHDSEAGEADGEVLAADFVENLAPAPVQEGMETVDELEELVLEDPENPDLHRRLGEALLLQGETSRASDEFELALSGYEISEQREHAESLVDLLITLHPDSVRYYQKRVEYAYRTGERERLLDAYLDLGDALLRMQADDKAAAVYGRVLEHEPDSPRARYGLQQLGLLEEVDAAADEAEEPAEASAGPELVIIEPAAEDAGECRGIRRGALGRAGTRTSRRRRPGRGAGSVPGVSRRGRGRRTCDR